MGMLQEVCFIAEEFGHRSRGPGFVIRGDALIFLHLTRWGEVDTVAAPWRSGSTDSIVEFLII
jgi:hypothetical protein